MTGSYLLFDLAYPLGSDALTQKAQAVQFKLPGLGITIQSVYLTNRVRGPFYGSWQNSGRSSFRLKDGAQDDIFAQRIADAIIATLGFITLITPLYDAENPLALWFPDKLLKDNLFLNKEALWSQEKYRSSNWIEDLRIRLGSVAHYDDYKFAKVWKILPAVLKNQHLFDALHFYQASLREFNFSVDSCREVLKDDVMSPVSRRESARGENSIVNAFKAIEAVIGDPPKDEARFKRKLVNASIDPNEWCGLGPRRETIGMKIRKMNDMRDKKAAHGRTGGDRQITYFDIMDCQACARLVLLKQFQDCFKPRKDGLQWWQTP